MNRLQCWVAATTLALLLPLSAFAQAQPKIITFGADLSAEQRAALLQRFGATEGTDTVLTVNADEMRAAMQNIIPVPEGYKAVSSTALTCAEPGSGLQVSTENITKVSAAMYALALVTAGVGDAELIVAAPADAQAEGMTGLTGVFKGLESGICGRGTLDTTRRDLAYRQLAVTTDLANATDGDLAKVSDLMLRAQQNLVRAGNNADAAVPSAESAQRDTGITLPQAQADELVQLLADIGQANIDWGTYANGWAIQQISANEVSVAATDAAQPAATDFTAPTATAGDTTPVATADVLAAAPTASADTAAPTASTGAAPTASNGAAPTAATLSAAPTAATSGNTPVGTAVASAAQQLSGTVTSVNPLRISGAGISDQLALDNAAITVVRNDQPATLADLQPNDTVNITLGANNEVQRIDARSATSAATGAVASQTVQGIVTRNANGTLSVNTAGGNQDIVANGSATQVRRNGQAAQLSDIQAGDTVTAQLDASGRPTLVEASGAQTGLFGGVSLLWCLLPLLLLLLLAFVLFRRRRQNGVVMVGRNRSTVIDEDGNRKVVDTDDVK